MRKQFNHLFISLVTFLFIAGCGTKGALYETPTTPEQNQQLEELKTNSESKKG